MENVRIGIIGIGNMGSSHVKWIMAGEIEHLVLTAVADIREERRAWVRETYPDVAVFDDAEALMTSGLVDAVLIATPHYLHPPLAIAELNHGLHVMSEKPAGVYTKAVREENELARKSDKTFAIMFNQRTHCMYRKVKEIIASGELGALRRVNWLITDWFRTQYYYDSGSWRATWDGEGGGVLLNQCPHNLDLLQWMVGMPVRVRAFTHNGKWHNIEVEDDVTAYMEFENGATGVFITSTGDMPGDNRLEIVMEGGTLLCDGGTLTLKKLSMPIEEYQKQYNGGPAWLKCETRTVELDGSCTQHQGVLRAFVDHILNGGPLVAEGTEGINSLMLSNAMYLSSWTGETVELPIDEDRFLEELNKRRKASAGKAVEEKTLDISGTF